LVLRRCECRNAAYCSVDCQRRDRALHRASCRREAIPFGIPRVLSLRRKNLTTASVGKALAHSLRCVASARAPRRIGVAG